MVSELEHSDAIKQLLKSIIKVMGRRSSEDYAVVMVHNVVKKITEKYTFLKYVKTTSVQYSETADIVEVDPAINSIEKHVLSSALLEILGEIQTSLGQNAGYFFMKELKNSIGPQYQTSLEKLGVNLGIIQLKHEVDKRKPETSQTIDIATVVTHIVQILLDILEKEVGRSFSYSTIIKSIEKVSEEHNFLQHIVLRDVRYNQTDEKISVSQDINKIEPFEVGLAIDKLVKLIHKSLEEKGIYTLQEQIRERLRDDYLSILKEIGVNLDVLKMSHEVVLKHVIKALMVVLSRASTQGYAALALDTALKKIDTKYEYLKYVKIDSAKYSDGIGAISIMTIEENINPTDARRAIQKLLEEIVEMLSLEAAQHFIEEFKRNLDKTCLIRIEEMGVNLHMIQLKQNMASLKRPI